MIGVNNELINAMHKLKDVFGGIVPLRELPQNLSNIEKKVDILLERFGYKKLEEDKAILM